MRLVCWRDKAYVEDRRAVQHVDAAHVQLRILAAEQLDNSEADRVWPTGRARGEDSVLAIVRRRRAEQLEVLRGVELPEHDQVRETFNVCEAKLEVRQDGDHAVCFMAGSKSLWYTTGFLIGSADKSDGPRREHMRLYLHSYVLFTANRTTCGLYCI
jgi:hypothetical protein